MRASPLVECRVCGDLLVVVPDGRGFPPDIAKRRLAKRCSAKGHKSDPQYRAGIFLAERVPQNGTEETA